MSFFVVARVGERRLWLVAVLGRRDGVHGDVAAGPSAHPAVAPEQPAHRPRRRSGHALPRRHDRVPAVRPPDRRSPSCAPDCRLARLERVVPDKRDGRRYLATRTDGALVDVTVLDRDQEGAGLGYRAWRLLRVRGPAAGRTYVSVRRSLEHEALLTYASAAAGARTPRAGRDVGGGRLRRPAGLRARRRPAAVRRPAGGRHRRRARRRLGAARLPAGGAAGPSRLHQRQPARLHRRPGAPARRSAAARSRPPTSHLRIDVAQLADDPRPGGRAPSGGAQRRVALGTEPLAEALPVLQPLVLRADDAPRGEARQGTARRGARRGARGPARGARGPDRKTSGSSGCRCARSSSSSAAASPATSCCPSSATSTSPT